MTPKVEIKDNEFLRQYEFHCGNEIARIEYSLQERKIFLTKFDVPKAIEDKGLTDSFIEAVFEEIKSKNIKLVPTCIEITSFIRRNRSRYKELLPPGINI